MSVCMIEMCLQLLLSSVIKVMLQGKIFSSLQRCNVEIMLVHVATIQNNVTTMTQRCIELGIPSCLNVIDRNKSQMRGNILAGPGILVHDKRETETYFSSNKKAQ